MYLFLDTETTGVPRARGAPLEAARQWPRLVQIAWAAYDDEGKCVTTEAHLVYPTDFAIPAVATRIHGISTAMAKSDGRALGWVIERFVGAVAEHGRVIVGHNVAFDRNVVAAASKVFPTRVGMNRSSPDRRGAGRGVPHPRGDEPPSGSSSRPVTRCSQDHEGQRDSGAASAVHCVHGLIDLGAGSVSGGAKTAR